MTSGRPYTNFVTSEVPLGIEVSFELFNDHKRRHQLALGTFLPNNDASVS
jgi:hypothetical protein